LAGSAPKLLKTAGVPIVPPMGTVASLRRSHLSMVAQSPDVALLIHTKEHFWKCLYSF
jgi:hypothetical protein